MERSQIRRLLWRWGRVLEYCRSKQKEMQGFQEIIDAHRSVSSPQLSGMPRGGKISNPTERAAMRVCELTDHYAYVVAKLVAECEQELRFQETMDELIDELSLEQQKILELRYKGGHAWVYVGLKIGKTEIRAKQLEADAVDVLEARITIKII